MAFASHLPGYAQAHAQPRAQTFKTFSDATNVTYANSGTAATQELDADAPFGAVRLKVTAPVGNTWTEVQLNTGPSVVARDGDTFAFRIFLEDWNAVSQIQAFAGVSGYTRYVQSTVNIQNSDRNNKNGPITITLNSHDTAANTLTWGSDTVANLKLRIFTRSGYSAVVWVDSFSLGYRARPKVVLTFDDASQSWIDYVQPYLSTAGILATFGVNTGDVGTNDSLYVSVADLLSLQDDGHDIQAHNVTNTAYDFTASGLSAYLAEYDTAVAYLRGIGITGPFIYHPFVQGKHDADLIDGLRSRGVRVMRTVDSASATACRLNQPGCGTYSDNLDCIKVGSHGAGLSLANALTNLTNLKKYGGTYFSMFHDITAGAASGVQWTQSDFEDFVDELVACRRRGELDVMSVSGWYQGLTQPTLVV